MIREFIVTYITDDGERNFAEFETWEEAYRWCEDAIVHRTSKCSLHWIYKTENFSVKHTRNMVTV